MEGYVIAHGSCSTGYTGFCVRGFPHCYYQLLCVAIHKKMKFMIHHTRQTQNTHTHKICVLMKERERERERQIRTQAELP